MKRYPMFMDWRVKVTILPKQYADSMQSLAKSQVAFLHKHKSNPKIHMNHKEFIMAKSILEKNKTRKSKVRGLILPNFKTRN